MSYHHFIFDLDGTLVDSAHEIHLAAAAICQKHGLSIPTEAYIRRMTGSPPRLFFLDHDCSEENAEGLVVEFRSHLAVSAGDPKYVFPTVIPLLQSLEDKGIRISLATTKPTDLATILLQRYGLAPYFSHIQGTDPPLKHKPHPDIVNACIAKSSVGFSVMVGDTIFDVEAARNAAIDSIAVATGAHSIDHLTRAEPTYLFSSLNQISGVLEAEP